jgi:Na+-transporting NADH:ubiquinone oxidoreductase subunit NqrD
MNAFFSLIACACIVIGRTFARTQPAMESALESIGPKCGEWAYVVRFVFDAIDSDFTCDCK